MIETIIFDFDGTIADTVGIGNTILQTLSTKYKFKKLSPEESEKMRDYTIKEMFKKSHVPFYKLPLLAHDIKKMMYKHVAYLKPIKGMQEVINTLKTKGYTLAIVTSNDKETVSTFLEKNNLNSFDFIYTGTTLFGKARVIQSLLNKYHLEKKSVIYIGDEIRDIEATKKVGIPIIAGSWGLNSRKGLERFSPEFLIDSPEEILIVLKTLSN